jgi:hypothetical protein
VTLPLDAPPLTTSQQAVLDALKAGPKTGHQLYSISPVWFSAVSTLRGIGYEIISDLDDSGDGGHVFFLDDQGGL